MELDVYKLDFKNLQNYAEKLPNYAANLPIMQKKNWLCSASLCCHGKGSISRVLDIL